MGPPVKRSEIHPFALRRTEALPSALTSGAQGHLGPERYPGRTPDQGNDIRDPERLPDEVAVRHRTHRHVRESGYVDHREIRRLLAEAFREIPAVEAPRKSDVGQENVRPVLPKM
jgi:hypothetical protein